MIKIQFYKKNNYLMILFTYWFVLFVWQNFTQSIAKSSVDIVLKIGLLIFFIYESVKYNGGVIHAKGVSLTTWLSLICSFVLTATFSIDGNTFSDLIAYSFTLIAVFIFLILLGEMTVSNENVTQFGKYIIAIDLFLVVYCFIFCGNYYKQIFSINSAYGNELSAFMSSSHEFAMYLAFGIFACLWCLKFNSKRTSQKIFYSVCIALFVLHILLSFSRTTMLACGVAGLVFLYNYKKTWFWTVLTFLGVILLYLFSQTDIIDYIYKIILKENNSADRGNMYAFAWDYFKNSSFIHQLFGIGLSSTGNLVNRVFGHGSFHCAYLQTLVAYGVFGLIFLISAIIMSMRNAFLMLRKDKFIGSWALSLAFVGICFMLTNTAIYFYSPIDSFMLTVCCVIVPKYVFNSYIASIDE